MTRDDVLKKIKKKFGTYARFARLAEMDRYEFQLMFITPAEVDAVVVKNMNKLVDSLSNTETPELTKKHIDLLRKAVDERGGVLTFCADGSFAANTVFQILGGAYKTITPTVSALMVKLGVKQ